MFGKRFHHHAAGEAAGAVASSDHAVPRGSAARATCLFAAALWAGCAGCTLTGFAAIDRAVCAAELADAALCAAGGCGAGCVAIVRLHDGRSTRVRSAIIAGLLALAALMLGAGLRLSETVTAAARPALALSDDRALARIEATLLEPFVERGGPTDILARYLVRPPRFQAVVEDIVFVDGSGARSRLLDPASRLTISAPVRPPDLVVGDRLSIVGWLRGPPRPSLPGSEGLAGHLALAGVAGGMTVASAGTIEVVGSARGEGSLRWEALRLRSVARSALRAGLLEGVPDEDASDGWAVRSMLVALVLGDVEPGYRSIDDSFRAVGLSHILAISGFNLAVLGWVAGAAARIVSRDERVHAIAVGLAALLALCLMAPAASAMRSALMAIVGACGAGAGRDWNGDAVLAIAAVLMLLASPSDAMNAGFQLSFGCVLALRHLAPAIARRWLDRLPSDDAARAGGAWTGIAGMFASRALSSGLAAFLTSVPVVLCHFGTLQPFGVILTLLCAPLATVTLAIAYPKAVVGGILAALPWDTTAWLGPVLWLPAWLQIALVDRAILSGAGSLAPGVMHWLPAAAVLVALWASAMAPTRTWRAAGAAIAVATMVIAPARSSSEPDGRSDPGGKVVLRATMFAVGDGSAYAVETGGAIVFFDAGSSSHGSIGSRALVPWVLARGGRVDAVFVSHPDIDHFSAVADLIRYTRVGTIYMHDSIDELAGGDGAAAELVSTARIHGTRIEVVGAGDAIAIGGADWSVLWPERGWRSRRDNDMSLVIRVAAPRIDGGSAEPARILLTGDIETEPAARLASRARAGTLDLRSDLMELPHHGSWREAVVGLIDEVDPAAILQSTASRRLRSDRFAPHIDGRRHRLVTCRDGTVQAVVRSDGSIDLHAWDPETRGQWRPVGHVAPRSRRPRPVAHPRRFKLVVLASRRARASTLPDERGAAKPDPVAGGPVSPVRDADLESLRGGPSSEGSGHRQADARARSALVEHDPLLRAVAEPHRELDARIRRGGLGEHDIGGEDERIARRAEGCRKQEPHLHRAIERDLAKAEQRLGRVLEAEGAVKRIAVRLRRRLDAVYATCREWEKRLGVEHDRDRHGCLNATVAALTSRAEERVGQPEHPAAAVVERDVLDADEGPVGEPDCGAASDSRLSRGERDRGDPFDGNAARCGRAVPRLGSIHRLLTAIARVVRAFASSVARFIGLGGRGPGEAEAGAGLLDRFDGHFRPDRVDEAAKPVAVEEKNRVAVDLGRGARVGAKPDLRETVDVDGNGTDPAVLPDRRGTVEPIAPGQQLPIVENKASGAQLGEERETVRERGSDQAGDDQTAVDALDRVGPGQREHLLVDGEDLRSAPGAVAQKKLGGDAPVRGLLVGWRRGEPEDGLGRSQALGDEGSATGCDGRLQAESKAEEKTEVKARQSDDARRTHLRRRDEGTRGRGRSHVSSFGSRGDGGTDAEADSPLEDRKIPLGHLKHDERHGGSVRVSLGIRPGPVGGLPREEFIANRRPPGPPAFAPREIHGLHRVVVPVEVVWLRESAADDRGPSAWKGVLAEIVEPALDRLVLVDPRIEEARDARRRPRPRRSSEVAHVAEPAVGVLARPDIADGVVDRGLGNLDPGVPRAPKRHHGADGHRHVGVVGNGVVPPAAFVVLARHDQLNGADKRVAHPVVIPIHPVDLAEEQRGESVPVHRPVRLVRDKQPCLRRMGEHEAQRLLDLLGVLAAARHVSIGEKRDRAQARDADMLSEATLAERAVGLLLAPQILESLAHRLLELRRDLLVGGSVLGADGRADGRGDGRGDGLGDAGAGLHWVRGHWRRKRGFGARLRDRGEEDTRTALRRGERGGEHRQPESHLDARRRTAREDARRQRDGGCTAACTRVRRWTGTLSVDVAIDLAGEAADGFALADGASSPVIADGFRSCRDIGATTAFSRRLVRNGLGQAVRRSIEGRKQPVARARGPPFPCGRGHGDGDQT